MYSSFAGGRGAAGFQVGRDSSNERTVGGSVGGAWSTWPFRRRATSARTRHMISSIERLCRVDLDGASWLFCSITSHLNTSDRVMLETLMAGGTQAVPTNC